VLQIKFHVFAKYVPSEDFAKNILPNLKNLLNDESPYVRKSLSSDLNNCAKILGKEYTLEHLVPLILTLFRDESSDVRYKAISNISELESVIGIEELTNRLLNPIITLAEDSQWRVRTSIISIIPQLAAHMKVDSFNQFIPIFINWLTGVVAIVRDEANKLIPVVAQIFGPEWFFDNIAEKLLAEQSPNCRFVKATVHVMESLSLSLTPDQKERVVGYVIAQSENRVPNIRIAVSQCLGKLLGGNTPDDLKQPIETALKRLVNDQDNDVKYEATNALKKLT